ncbi:MAG: YbaK/EbsC family protein [Acidimicrobiales bacterium]
MDDERQSQDWSAAEASVDAALASVRGPAQVASWEMIDCDPDLADTAAFCEAYGYAPEDSANTIVVAAKEDPPRYVACVVLANTRLDVNRAVRKRLGTRKASFATAEETRALTGMAIGGVTAVGLPAGLPIWVDAAVMARPQVVLGGGSRRRKLVSAPDLLRSVPGVEIVEGLALPAPPTDPTTLTTPTDPTGPTTPGERIL